MNLQTSHSRPLSWRALVFWPVSFGAVALMGLALLSPKLGELRRDQEVFVANQHKLVQLEADGQAIEQLIEAFGNDPRFRAEVAKSVFGHQAPSQGKSFSLPEELTHDTSSPARPTASEANWVTEMQPQWLVDAIAPWERNAKYRSMSLMGAGAILLGSFLLLNPSHRRTTRERVGIWARLKSRYWHDAN